MSLGDDLAGEMQRGEVGEEEEVIRGAAEGGGKGGGGGEVGKDVPSLISEVTDRNLTFKGLMTTDLQRVSSSSSSSEVSSSSSSSSSSRSSSDGMVREIPG